MEYRAARPEEIPLLRRAEEYCFFVPPSDYDGYVEHQMRPALTRALFGPEGELKAGLINFPLKLYIGGARLGMGGVAGVVSWPESRREGHVGDLLTRLIAEERQRGVPLSGLYPFKQSFYRRYGWEVASAWIRHDMPTELLLHHRGRPGTVRRYAPGEADWRTLEAIYAARYSSGYGYIVRETAEHWADWVNPLWNPPAYHYHTAIWHRSPGAEPEGYLLYRFLKDDQDKWLLVVKELVALNTDAELGLYGYIAQHDSQVRTCRFRTSRDYPVWHLAENMSSTKSTLESGWMLRLVDLKLAYEQRPWPDTPDGTLTIAITDPHAPWNENTWRITFDSARAAVSPAPAETSQLSADITTLAQLWAGFIRPEQAVATGRLHCSDPRALDFLRAKEMWFYEFF